MWLCHTEITPWHVEKLEGLTDLRSVATSGLKWIAAVVCVWGCVDTYVYIVYPLPVRFLCVDMHAFMIKYSEES